MRPAIAGCLFLALGCGDTTGPGPVATGDLSQEWQTASPASQGLDPVGISAAVAHARTLPRILSLLVVRNGVLVVEEYLNGNRADSLNDGRSVTKSVMSTLVGVALYQGLLPDLAGRIDEYLPPSYLEGLAAANVPSRSATSSPCRADSNGTRTMVRCRATPSTTDG